MKKKLLFAIPALLLAAGAVFFIGEKRAWCFTNCPVGKKCYGDMNCNTISCNLSCVAVDRLGVDKRCMVTQ